MLPVSTKCSLDIILYILSTHNAILVAFYEGRVHVLFYWSSDGYTKRSS